MKLQYLIVIFLVIVIPVVLIMSQYTSLQIDTLAKKTQYDTALLGATFDTMAAFELNTINSASSSVVGEEIRDIEAIISTFTNSLSASMDIAGIEKDYILSYVPAMVFTLYDGYYIYSVSGTTGERELKPYVYYTKTYENGVNTDVTIAFSLDNYVSIYGKYDGKPVSAAGYLVVPEDVVISDTFTYVTTTKEDGSALTKVIDPGGLSTITYKGINIGQESIYENYAFSDDVTQLQKDKKEQTTDAMMYYYEAKQFTLLYNEVVSALKPQAKDTLTIRRGYGVDPGNDPEDKASKFMNEKVDVIKNSITSNLNAAIYNYEGSSGEECEMPQLNGEDWDKILNDISIIAFLKDIPIGTTSYNNYVVVNSTTNKKYASAESIEFIAYKQDAAENAISKGHYHKITCEDFCEEIKNNSDLEIVGYASVDFERHKYSANEENKYYYYYKHNEYADYDCEVNSIQSVGVAKIAEKLPDDLNNNIKEKILDAYYSAVGRVRYRLVKPSSYIKLSDTTKEFKARYYDINGNLITWNDEEGNLFTDVYSEHGRIRVTQQGPDIIGELFLGWSSLNNNTVDVKVGDTLYLEDGEVIDLYAVYGEQFTITYHSNAPEGSVISMPPSATKIESEEYVIPNIEPSRENHNFLGWSTDPDAEEADPNYAKGSTYNEDAHLNLYAVWADRIVTVTFCGKKTGMGFETGKQIKIASVEYIVLDPVAATTIEYPDYLNREGYDLIGWSRSPSTTAEPDPTYAPGERWYGEDLKLYAVWRIKTYQIQFDDNVEGEDLLPSDLKEIVIKEHDRAYKIPSEEDHEQPKRTSYTFKGWDTDPDATGNGEYQPGDWYEQNESVTLFAIWEGSTYTIEYNANGGNNAPPKQEGLSKDVDAVLSMHIPTRTGYEFVGWSSNKNATEAEYTPGATYTERTGIRLYAVWKTATYTIKYMVDGEQFGETQEKTYGENITIIPNKPTKAGYNFWGWSKNEGSTIVDYYANDVFGENQNTILYPVWSSTEEREEGYQMVEYDANGGEWPIGANGEPIPVPAGLLTGVDVYIIGEEYEPTRAGYTFLGWSTNPNATTPEYTRGQQYEYQYPYTETDVVGAVLYAVWEGNDSVVLTVDNYRFPEETYNLNPGEQMEIGRLDHLVWEDDAPEFVSWKVKSGDAEITPVLDASGKIVNYEITMGTQDSTVVAQYYWMLTYNANEYSGVDWDTIPESSYVISYESITLSAQVPRRTGYIFKGWSTNKYATSDLLQPEQSYYKEGYGSVTLYAIWGTNQYRVHFDANGGTGAPTDQMKNPGEDLILSSLAPTRDGYKFVGWSEDPTAITPQYFSGGTYSEDADVTLYAVWKEIEEISITINGGEEEIWEPCADKSEKQSQARYLNLTVEVTPADAGSQSITWTSNNTDVIKIVNSSTGRVKTTGLAGKATITATATNGAYDTIDIYAYDAEYISSTQVSIYDAPDGNLIKVDGKNSNVGQGDKLVLKTINRKVDNEYPWQQIYYFKSERTTKRPSKGCIKIVTTRERFKTYGYFNWKYDTEWDIYDVEP